MSGLCLFCTGDSSDEHKRSKKIENQLEKDRKQLKREIRILLLGTGESGKSTLIKQMNIIHGAGEFTADEVRSYRQQIYQNVISGMRVLLDARRKLNIPWEMEERQNNIDQILKFTTADLLKGIDYTTFVGIAPIVSEMWRDSAVRKTYDQRNLFQLSDSCQYFFEHLHRIAQPDFYPTNKDILYCRKASRGISEHTFFINQIPFRFIDVGGQRSQRQKWFQCFTDITSILFLVASNEYDQVVLEDRRTNRVVESRSVFETIVNNKAFSKVSIILFMNKSDLLHEKLASSDIRQYFADFQGNQTSLRDVQYFLVDKFESSRKDRARPFFYHFTTAVDTENIRRVFKDVRETILEQNLQSLMMH